MVDKVIGCQDRLAYGRREDNQHASATDWGLLSSHKPVTEISSGGEQRQGGNTPETEPGEDVAELLGGEVNTVPALDVSDEVSITEKGLMEDWIGEDRLVDGGGCLEGAPESRDDRGIPLVFGRPSQNLEILPRLLKLIRLLLFSLPEGQVIADILRAAYLQAPTDQDNTFAPEPPFFPYYTLVTNINFRRYLLEEISVNIQDQDQQVVMVKAAAREFRSELIWSLCEANAGRIKNLTIPIMDISRYVSMIPRLKVLSKVTFLMGKGLKPDTRFRLRYTPDQQEALELLSLRRISVLEEMITFTHEHCRLFPNVLMIARCHKDSCASNDDCPHQHQFRLLQSLPPLIRPTALNDHN
ncbi:MAG: hypothetical protein J3R72DRAFT_491097 [Linnemannia gamsii]|nr:MAG: hypothetical protein J3R72DRAFT_491097 [Linnemannia gamsii]